MKRRLKALTKKTCRIAFPVTERLLEKVFHRRVERTSLHQPIFVIGPDRSGTSLVYALLANHPDVFTPSIAAEWFPDHPLSASLARRVFSLGAEAEYRAVPNTNGLIEGGRFRLREANPYWNRHLGTHCGGFHQRSDDFLSEEDLDDTTRRTLPLDLRKRIAVMGKKRLVVKQPGFSLKIRYLNALFPDAVFVHCLRDPLDNFSSLMEWKINTHNPHWGVVIPGWLEMTSRSVAVQTAHQLAGTYDLIQQSLHHLGDPAGRYVPVRYEAFQAGYVTEVQKLFGGCQLEAPAGVLQHPEVFARAEAVKKHRRELQPDPVARQILEALGERMGYRAR